MIPENTGMEYCKKDIFLDPEMVIGGWNEPGLGGLLHVYFQGRLGRLLLAITVLNDIPGR